jgi:hypothetical protein
VVAMEEEKDGKALEDGGSGAAGGRYDDSSRLKGAPSMLPVQNQYRQHKARNQSTCTSPSCVRPCCRTPAALSMVAAALVTAGVAARCPFFASFFRTQVSIPFRARFFLGSRVVLGGDDLFATV